MQAAIHQPLINCQPSRVAPRDRGAWILRSVTDTLRLWGTRIRERRAFPVIDDRELRDLGVSRWELQHELAKPFWRG